LALGAALEHAGCEVEFYGFQHAFGSAAGEDLNRQLRFPWQLARFLRRRAADFDVIDAMTGDAWVWASLRRPGARGHQALVTRAHGLEHVMSESRRRAAADGGAQLSWKYPLYHGGLRLWEVRRSMVLADHCVLLNATDRDYTRERMGIAPERLTVMPNAIGSVFLAAPDVSEVVRGPVQLAFIGSWIVRKGVQVLVDAVEQLVERELDFSLAMLGTRPTAAVMAAFSPEAAERVTVTPDYPNDALPRLLQGCEILAFPSLAEGSSIALLEAMASGLAPVATRVGAAPEVIQPGIEGLLIDPGNAGALVDAIESLAGDRTALAKMRRAAQQKARGYRWDQVAEKTVDLYERLVTASSTAATKRGPTRSHV
jgi:glycosyltransferase involved in cell wall biosynthesis